MGFRTEEVIYRGGGSFGKFLPGTFLPFTTFVLTKKSPYLLSTLQPALPKQSPKPWMVLCCFIIIAPIVLLSWITDRILNINGNSPFGAIQEKGDQRRFFKGSVRLNF
jgi:hypothetical protein